MVYKTVCFCDVCCEEIQWGRYECKECSSDLCKDCFARCEECDTVLCEDCKFTKGEESYCTECYDQMDDEEIESEEETAD